MEEVIMFPSILTAKPVFFPLYLSVNGIYIQLVSQTRLGTVFALLQFIFIYTARLILIMYTF